MNRTFVTLVVVLATMMIVGEAAYTYSKLGNFYYYTEPFEAVKNQVQNSMASTSRANAGIPGAYQKYVACVARTFFFQACTLCYCTNVPNVALCWNYERDKCAEIRRQVDQQINAVNNDPNGVW